MAVTYRSSSASGTGDTSGESCTVPVPAGATAGDIALLALEQWWNTSPNPTVTWPAGFTQIIDVVTGSFQKLKVAWKRLSAADTGSYQMTWSGSQWNMGHCVLIIGGLVSGDPIQATNTASGTGTGVPTTTVAVSTQAFLAHFVANENSATSTPPTNFTEVQDGNYLHTNYRIPDTTGSQSASGGTLSASTPKLAALIAVEAESGVPAADTTLHVALGIDGAAAKTGQASTTLGVDLGIAATAVKRGIADASLGLDLGIAATVGEPVPPSYLSVTVGPLRDPLLVDTMRDPMLVDVASGEVVTVGALRDTAPTIGELRDEQSPTIGELRDPLAVDEMREPVTINELRE